jgi:ABC-2 type transport system permease protein
MNLFYQELKKLFRIFISDLKPIAAGLIAPSAILIIFCLIFGNFSPLPIKIINNDSGNFGGKLRNEITAQISPLGNKPYFEDITERNNKTPVATITIPSDFSESIINEKCPVINMDINNFNSDFAKNIRLYLQEGIVSFYSKYYPQWDINITEILPKNGQAEWVEIIASGSILLAAILGGMFLYLYLFFKEKHYGTILLYSISPRAPSQSFFARIFICWGFAIINITVNMALALVLTGRNFFTISHIIYPALSLVALFFICLSSLVSTYLENFITAAMITMFGCVLVWFMSGGINNAPIDNTSITGAISIVFPNRYALDIIRTRAFYLSTENILRNYLILIGMVLIMTLVSYLALYKKYYKPANA